jgi:hypothetical protein
MSLNGLWKIVSVFINEILFMITKNELTLKYELGISSLQVMNEPHGSTIYDFNSANDLWDFFKKGLE